MTTWAAIAALVGAALGGLITLIANRQRFSGNIRSSEAEKLWDVLGDRLEAANVRTTDLEKRVAACEAANNDLRERNIDLLAENKKLEWTVIELRSRVADLELANAELKERLK